MNDTADKLNTLRALWAVRQQQIIERKAYHGTGFTAWKRGGSVQERVVEYLEEKEEQHRDSGGHSSENVRKCPHDVEKC